MYYFHMTVFVSLYWPLPFIVNVLVLNKPFIIKRLGPKGLKLCSYVEKCVKLKNQSLKKSADTQKCYAQRYTIGVGNMSK